MMLRRSPPSLRLLPSPSLSTDPVNFRRGREGGRERRPRCCGLRSAPRPPRPAAGTERGGKAGERELRSGLGSLPPAALPPSPSLPAPGSLPRQRPQLLQGAPAAPTPARPGPASLPRREPPGPSRERRAAIPARSERVPHEGHATAISAGSGAPGGRSKAGHGRAMGRASPSLSARPSGPLHGALRALALGSLELRGLADTSQLPLRGSTGTSTALFPAVPLKEPREGHGAVSVSVSPPRGSWALPEAPRDVLTGSAPTQLKKRLDSTLRHTVGSWGCPVQEQELCFDDPFGFLLVGDILWFSVRGAR
ncbi:uncharacterized protein LOC141728876 [Zonotrichia albicollis]|uniref:uncharacterized protein LOC141728876 n=1 Tax=Zonotrichia albicollis TaxID=44394 RepID=UPI003D80CEB9